MKPATINIPVVIDAKRARKRQARQPYQYPRVAEDKLAKAYKKRVASLFVQISKVIREWSLQNKAELLANSERLDALGDGPIFGLLSALAELKKQWLSSGTPESRAIDETTASILRSNKEQLQNTFKDIIGITPQSKDMAAPLVIDAFKKKSRDILQQLDITTIDTVGSLIKTAVVEGKAPEAIFNELKEAKKKATRKAELTARNDVATLNRELTEARHKELGVSRYIWQSMEDERVRPRHVDYNQSIFEWSTGSPENTHPGDDFLCRCIAIPVVTDLMDEL